MELDGIINNYFYKYLSPTETLKTVFNGNTKH